MASRYQTIGVVVLIRDIRTRQVLRIEGSFADAVAVAQTVSAGFDAHRVQAWRQMPSVSVDVVAEDEPARQKQVAY